MAKRAIVQALCYGPIAPFLLGMLTSGVFQVFRSGGVKRRTSRDSCSMAKMNSLELLGGSVGTCEGCEDQDRRGPRSGMGPEEALKLIRQLSTNEQWYLKQLVECYCDDPAKLRQALAQVPVNMASRQSNVNNQMTAYNMLSANDLAWMWMAAQASSFASTMHHSGTSRQQHTGAHNEHHPYRQQPGNGFHQHWAPKAMAGQKEQHLQDSMSDEVSDGWTSSFHRMSDSDMKVESPAIEDPIQMVTAKPPDLPASFRSSNDMPCVDDGIDIMPQFSSAC